MGIKSGKILFYVDKMELLDETIHVTGWAVSKSGTLPKYRVLDKNGREKEITFRRLNRPDASMAALKNESQSNCGFDIKFTCTQKENYRLEIYDSQARVRVRLSYLELLREQKRRFVSVKKMIRMTTPSMLADDARTLLKRGPRALKSSWETRYETDENRYLKWLTRRDEDLEMPIFVWIKISIVVPLYRTPLKYLGEMIDSVRAQNYDNWELLLADGSGDEDPMEKAKRKEYLEEVRRKDPRVKYKELSENKGIAGNTNEALSVVIGDWVAFMDHDDILSRHALSEMAAAVEKHPQAEMIYSDEDKVSMDLRTYFEPHLKPDFNLDLIRSTNYISHFLMVKRELAQAVGGFDASYDGAQDYDFILKCSERAKEICHIPKVLYHWRMHPFSTSENPESKMYCFDAGRRAIKAHLERCNVEGEVSLIPEHLGYYHVKYPVKGNPLVSIIIPNKDQGGTLLACVDSILEKSTYKNFEILIVENNSEKKETFELYDALTKKDERIRILYWKEEFNYSAINNFGANQARGEYLLLLNNDTTVIAQDWIEGLLSNCQRPEVGVTGAKLYYPDGTIQHAGVVLKLAGVCGHIFCAMEGHNPGPFARAVIQQDYSAVTAACLMADRKVWEEVGGLDESFQVAYNDVDFCLRVREAGYLVVYNPRVELYHYESKTRGYEDDPGKQERFKKEKDRLFQRWPAYLEKGDPYYNPNLTLKRADGTIDMEI